MMVRCTVCNIKFPKYDFSALASHFIEQSNYSDSKHIAWLNKNISKDKKDVYELEVLLKQFFDFEKVGLQHWVIQRFIQKFYSDDIHPFVEKMQDPSRGTLLGYVLEHQHFLKQWVRSCAFIMAKSQKDDVIRFESENITSEYGGHEFCHTKPHVEYLIEMGESLGLSRQEIVRYDPLPATVHAIEYWDNIAQNNHWLETMLAMHGLELIANKNLRSEGAKKHYFDPELLESDKITEEAKAFLKEGYEADVHHAGEALKLVEKYALEYDIVDDVQSTFLRSIDVFDSYLMSRLERGKEFA